MKRVTISITIFILVLWGSLLHAADEQSDADCSDLNHALEGLQSERPAIRVKSLKVLEEYNLPASRVALEETLIHDDSSRVRVIAARALGHQKNSSSEVTLQAVACDPDHRVAATAIRALGQIQAFGQEKLLIGVLTNSNVDLETCTYSKEEVKSSYRPFTTHEKAAAAAALGQLKSKEAVPALVGALESNDHRLVAEAILALGQIGDESVAEDIKEVESNNTLVRMLQTQALGQLEAK